MLAQPYEVFPTQTERVLCLGQGVLNLIDNGTTDNEGMAALVNKDGRKDIPGYTDSFALIEYNGRIMLVPDIHLRKSTFSSKNTVVSTLLDRKLVRPGETLFVKGKLMGTLESSASTSIGPLLQYTCFRPATNVLGRSRADSRLNFSISA